MAFTAVGFSDSVSARRSRVGGFDVDNTLKYAVGKVVECIYQLNKAYYELSSMTTATPAFCVLQACKSPAGVAGHTPNSNYLHYAMITQK